MEKKTLVERAFERGLLLSPELLEKGDERVLGRAESGDIVLIPLPGELFETEVPDERATLTVMDFVDFYREKYEGIRKLLAQKMEPVSMGSVGRGYADASVIGMVASFTPSGFVAEDPTGSIEIISQKKPSLTDVVGVTGTVREGRLVEQELVYPDIPLPKEVKKADMTLILSPKKVDGEGTQIVLEGEGALPKLPAKLRVAGVEILVCGDEGNPLDWLRKRHLPERVKSPKDFYLIEKVPDILWVVSGENKTESYKGVTVVQTDREHFAKVDMRTREVEIKKI